jgi:hypothetical protein
VNESTVFQITKLARTPEERDEIIALTGKKTMQRMIAELSQEFLGDRYRVNTFQHRELPFER